MIFFNSLLKRYALYLGLIPLIFFIRSLLSYPFHVSPLDIVICLSALAISSYILFRIALYLLKNKYKAAYFSFFILILCFLGVDIYYVVLISVLRIRYYLADVILIIGLCFWILKTRQVSKEINNILNIFTIVFFCLFLFNSVSSIKEFLSKSDSISISVNNNHINSQQFPDIYILLSDGYANSNNLKKYWHFSNSAFLDSLRMRGFYIVDSSRSNYRATVQTVSSMLNMEYCGKKYTGEESPFLADIADSQTINTLAQNNYKIYNYSIFDFDKYSSTNRLSAFAEKSSLLYYCLTESIYFFYIKLLLDKEELANPYQKTHNLYNQLIAVSKLKSDKPKFVYGHFFLSHPHFYLDSMGKINKKVQELAAYTTAEADRFANKDTTDNTFGTPEKDRFIMQSYLNHIKASNKHIYPIVKSILANSSRPPIILVMSDHGFRYTTGITYRESADESYGNLCAFYFPDKDYHLISKSITPVNYMRLILSKALGNTYKPLPDKSNL